MGAGAQGQLAHGAEDYPLVMPAPTIDELLVGDDAARWAGLGFTGL